MALNSESRIDVDPTMVGRSALLQTPVGTWLPRTGQFSVPTRNMAPFLGVAYSPKINTVIRTGFRLSYDDVFEAVPVADGVEFSTRPCDHAPKGSLYLGDSAKPKSTVVRL